MKKTILSQAIRAAVSAMAVLVGQSAVAEPVRAPRATFTFDAYTAKPGKFEELVVVQARIAELRRFSQHEDADALHRHMLQELMQPAWQEVNTNLVTTAGLNDILDKYFGGSGYTAAWFCGLVSSASFTAYAAGDTMASHAGWLEAGGSNAPTYTGNRPALTFGAASAGVKATSSASSFTFTGAGTIRGAFTNSVTTKDGTTGVLYNAVDFTGGTRTVANTDVVNVSVSFSAT